METTVMFNKKKLDYFINDKTRFLLEIEKKRKKKNS